MEKLRVHGPINNNDDWAHEATAYTSDVMAKYMTGQPLTVLESRLIDNIRAHIGIMPESPQRYCARVTAEAAEVRHDVEEVIVEFSNPRNLDQS